MNQPTHTYIIEYTCLDKEGRVLASGKMKAKNKMSEFDAKASFENYLIKKHPSFGRLIVVKCEKMFDFSDMADMFSKNNTENIFKDFFNPKK